MKRSKPKRNEEFLPQLTLVGGVVDLLISDKTGYAGNQFSIEQFAGFKVAVNKFDYNDKKHCHVEAEKTGIIVCIYRDGENIELSMSGRWVGTSITFSVEEWEKFKKQVNEFDVEVIQEKRNAMLAAAERTNLLSLIPKFPLPPIAKKELIDAAKNKFEISQDRVLALLRELLRDGTIYEPSKDSYRIP